MEGESERETDYSYCGNPLSTRANDYPPPPQDSPQKRKSRKNTPSKSEEKIQISEVPKQQQTKKSAPPTHILCQMLEEPRPPAGRSSNPRYQNAECLSDDDSATKSSPPTQPKRIRKLPSNVASSEDVGGAVNKSASEPFSGDPGSPEVKLTLPAIEAPRKSPRPSVCSSMDASPTVPRAGRDRSVDRSSNKHRERSNSNKRGGHVREMFLLQSHILNIGTDESIVRNDILSEEALEFFKMFHKSLVVRFVSSETPERLMTTRQEDTERSVIRKQFLTALEQLRVDNIREKESVAVIEIMPGENRLYDRMMRKRQQLGLDADPSKALGSELAKQQLVADLGKQVSEEDVAHAKKEIPFVENELMELEATLQNLRAAKGRKDKDKELQKLMNERTKKQEKLAKLREIVRHHEQYLSGEGHRVERAQGLKGIDKDVLTGKKTVGIAKMEKDLERKKKQHEEELEEMLRRALMNDKGELATGPGGRVAGESKLPAISRSAEPPPSIPPSISENPLKGNGRRRANSNA